MDRAATLLGTLETDVKSDITATRAAVESAVSSWKQAPRIEEFKKATFGIQTEMVLVASGAAEVSQIAGQFATAWKAADAEIADYGTRAARIKTKLEDPTTDANEKLLLAGRLSTLTHDAKEARTALDELAGELAALVNAQVNKLVPDGSTLSPHDIRQRVNATTGATSMPPGDPKSAWAMLKSASVQGQQVLDLVEDNPDGELVGGPVTSLTTDPELLNDLLVAARRSGLAPNRYAAVLHQYWVAKAAADAGIDLDAWDPSKGVLGNQSTISAVYTYYGKLYLQNPSKLQWAGMANMIGPSFAAGFMDLDMFKRLAGNVLGPAERLPDWAQGMLPSPLKELNVLGDLSAHEMAYFERKFLAMQKHIFFDQAAMHQAYVDGGPVNGMKNIEEMRRAGLIDTKAQQAWKDIDSGNPTKIKAGNTALLDREQNQIINRQYDDMRNYHGPVGEAMTYMMTVVGSASIPGTKTPAQFDPFSFEIKGSAPVIGPEARVKVKTSLPGFNVADKDSRWKYVTGDTLPAYQKLLSEDPEEARRIIGRNVDDRIAEQRLSQRWPTLAKDLLTDWEIDGNVGYHVGPWRVDVDFP